LAARNHRAVQRYFKLEFRFGFLQPRRERVRRQAEAGISASSVLAAGLDADLGWSKEPHSRETRERCKVGSWSSAGRTEILGFSRFWTLRLAPRPANLPAGVVSATTRASVRLGGRKASVAGVSAPTMLLRGLVFSARFIAGAAPGQVDCRLNGRWSV